MENYIKMENNNYPQWKYKIDLAELHKKRDNEELDFKGYIFELYNKIQSLKKKINKSDSDLKEEIEKWEGDMWFEDSTEENGIGIIKNDDDWEEIEFELNTLYDIGDCNKMIWFGI